MAKEIKIETKIDEEFPAPKSWMTRRLQAETDSKTDKKETAGEHLLKKYQEERTRDEVRHRYDGYVLTDNEEKNLVKKLNKERMEELQNELDTLTKGYIPKENLDLDVKVDDSQLIKTVAEAFGLKEGEFRSRFPQLSKSYESLPDKAEKGVPNPEAENVYKKYVENSFNDICSKIMELHERKNKDYGNAADASYREFGLVSYVIRLNDKLNRLKSLIKPGATMEVKDESLVDTFMDMAAYSIMAIESLLN